MSVLSRSLTAAFILLFMASPVSAEYWLAANGVPVRSGAGECIKSGAIEKRLKTPGCDVVERVILLPDASGHVGAVEVTAAGKTQRIDQAYSTVYVGSDGEAEMAQASATEIQAKFGALLQAQPLAEATFTVRFLSGSATELTADSDAVIRQLFQDLDQRTAPEVRLVGHTDTVGALLANDRLSRQRAQTVADILIDKGIARTLLEVTGRGERELAVKTADKVDEPANRRVEIRVR